MIYLQLFLTFLEIGAVSFGGGYAMIPLIREKVLSHGWHGEEDLLNMIAVSESTPGPIAVNMATFIGSEQGGIFGAMLATLGVVLPSFIIILLISSVITGFLKYKGVKAVLGGIRPCVVGLITGVGVTMLLTTLLGLTADGFSVDLGAVIIFAIVTLIAFLWQKIKKKKISPILLIVISAVLGMIVYSL
jgi:chromate transporter